jgi:hypothetical protein
MKRDKEQRRYQRKLRDLKDAALRAPKGEVMKRRRDIFNLTTAELMREVGR